MYVQGTKRARLFIAFEIQYLYNQKKSIFCS